MPSRAKEEDSAPSPESEAQSPPNVKKRTSSFAEIEVDLDAPEPPSKRARRALKKGKALPAKPASDDEADLKEDERTRMKLALKYLELCKAYEALDFNGLKHDNDQGGDGDEDEENGGGEAEEESRGSW